MSHLDMDRIAQAIGAERKGKVRAGGGYFGALELAADVQSHFRTPPGGGRATDPRWTKRRQIPLAPRTLETLERAAAALRDRSGIKLEPMQLAAILLERTAEQLREDGDVGGLLSRGESS